MRDNYNRILLASFALNLVSFISNVVLITTIGSINNEQIYNVSQQIENLSNNTKSERIIIVREETEYSEIEAQTEQEEVVFEPDVLEKEDVAIEETEYSEIEAQTEQEEVVFEPDVLEEDISEEAFANTNKERLPVGINTNRFDCEDYSFGMSEQYKLQQYCLTDENGLRYFYHEGEKFYCVGMGGAYGIDIGDSWFVTLECGSKFGIILSDYQHSIEEVDPNDFGERFDSEGNILLNYDGEPVVHVLEFVVDISLLNRKVLKAGTVSALEEFGGLYGNGGNLIDISYNGRIWNGRIS